MSVNPAFPGRSVAGAYAGVGSRRQSSFFFRLQVRIAMMLALVNSPRRLRTGGAVGSDEAFELGVLLAVHVLLGRDANPTEFIGRPEFLGDNDPESLVAAQLLEVFLPWAGFRGRAGCRPGEVVPQVSPALTKIASDFHPNPGVLSKRVMGMMRRNVCQVLGADLNSPSDFIVCYTPDGADGRDIATSRKTGGTGQAIRVAAGNSIKVLNFGNPETRKRLVSRIEDFDRSQPPEATTKVIADSFLDRYNGFSEVVEGNLVESFLSGQSGLDAIVHGCNCFNTMGSGVAAAISRSFPDAVVADSNTKRGNSGKLGTYSFSEVPLNNGSRGTVINAYTQFRYGHVKDGEAPHVDCEAVRRSFMAINRDFAGCRIGIPMLGAGTAGGEWYSLAGTIREASSNLDVVLYRLPAKG